MTDPTGSWSWKDWLWPFPSRSWPSTYHDPGHVWHCWLWPLLAQVLAGLAIDLDDPGWSRLTLAVRRRPGPCPCQVLTLIRLEND